MALPLAFRAHTQTFGEWQDIEDGTTSSALLSVPQRELDNNFSWNLESVAFKHA